MNIGVEVSSREDGLRKQEKDNRVLILSYRDNGNTSTVNFMSGTKISTIKDKNNNEVDYRALTSNPMDMYVTDLIDYGTTEMIGVKSVNIDYDSGYIPKITIQFTDVRGMSLFQPKELNYDHSVNGIRGLSKGNIAQTFFQCFFDLPLPKFTIQIKGFYGKPVAYQMMCESFDSNFNSATGDFDITAKFIGYGFSFMSDIAFDALISAPYSDYFGEDYWNSQVEAGRFKIPDKNGVLEDMPRLYDIRKNFETIFNDANSDFQNTSLTNEEMHHNVEIESLKSLRKNVVDWYDKFYSILETKYGKELVYLYKNGDGYDRLLLLANNSKESPKDLKDLFSQLDDTFKVMTSDLYSQIKEYNESGKSFAKIKNIEQDFSNYKLQKIFNKLYIDVNTSKFVFDGFYSDCDLPRKKTIDLIFPTSDNQDKANQIKLRKLYNDGINQYIYGFVIEVDYSALENKIKSLENDANLSADEKTKKEKRRLYNQSMFEKMNWYPTIENFTKVVMAHLETLMAMMYNVVTKVSETGSFGRTVDDLGVSLENCSDINSGEDAKNQFIPPFPRITRLVTEEDGITKREDAWIGEFGKPGGEIPEVDMINGLFNGITKINELEQSIQAAINQAEREKVDLSDKACVVKYPTTPYDFYITKNLYGDENEISTDIYTFIGKVALRMFDVLAINTFRHQYGANWASNAEKLGKIEAMNFNELVRLRDTNVFKAINLNGEFENGEKAWQVLMGEYGPMKEGNKCPWGGGKLLNDDKDGVVWLDLYKSSRNEFIYPAQNFDFKELEEAQKLVNDSKYPNENDNIIISDINTSTRDFFSKKYIVSSEDNAFYNLFIEEDRERFNNAIVAASSSSNEEAYSDICINYISKAVEYKPEAIKAMFASDDGNNHSSFVNTFGTEHTQKTGISKATYDEFYHLSDDRLDSYVNTKSNNEITSIVSLSEVFGTSEKEGKYVIDKTKSYFRHGVRESYSKVDNTILTGEQFETIFFLMGVNGINFSNVSKAFGDKNSFIYLPKLAILQIGAVLSVVVAENGKTWDFKTSLTQNDIDSLTSIIPIPDNFNGMVNIINKLNAFGKMYIIKYFLNWATKNYSLIMKLYERGRYIDTEEQVFDGRYLTLLKQDSDAVKTITAELLSIVILIRGNVNSFKNSNGTTLTRNDCKITKDNVIAYLNASLDKLRALNNIGDESGNLTHQAKVSEKTTDDMKMELYRYLKQIYDKWIPTTDFKDWKFETFFEERTNEEVGHQFHFIDSYYNKTNKKLLINPKMLSDNIATSLSYTDINVMMHSFLADVYAAHRCMLRCVQNFADLGDPTFMQEMFKPLEYNSMGSPKVHPDFVVIYTYEPSRNLNIENGEYKDDGFMLNEEMETPIAIRTRRVEDKDKYYRIPAFGVSYGRQYQSYFKNVSVNMSSPIQTQQAIIAKHAILKASRSEKSKTVTAQDLYDIYSTQSYTCNVEMMGCAWVQPMMYFVLLNIPMFRGSYMIMKVNHKIMPGNMVTTFTGCRMANVGNRFIEDIFSDEDVNDNTGEFSVDEKEKNADINNDCPYKVFPLIENHDDYDLSADELTKAKTLMEYLKGAMADVSNKEIIAAGIAGNMFHESGLDPTAQNKASNSTASGLIQWTSDGLGCMLNDDYSNYYYASYKITTSMKPEIKKRLETDRGAEFQCKFVIKSMKENSHSGGVMKKAWNSLTAQTTASGAAKVFFDEYERANDSSLSKRQNAATRYYNNRNNDVPTKETTSTSPELTNDNIHKLLFDAVQKSLASTNSSAALVFAHTKEKPNEPTLPLTITQQDGKTTHLAKVFDILLNTPDYYKHVQTLYWACPDGSGAQSDAPQAVIVNAALKASEGEQCVYAVGLTDGFIDSTTIARYNFVLNEGQKPEDVVNKNLLLPLYKHFGGNLDKRYPQFKSKELFKDIEITNCGNIMGGGTSTEKPSNAIPGVSKIKIDNFDVGNAVQWLIDHDLGCSSPTHCGKGLCATHVEDAIKAGGLKRLYCTNYKNTQYATNLHYGKLLENINGTGDGFKCIYSGTCDPNNRVCGMSGLQAGDISIIGRDMNNAGETGSYHACMWTGKEWFSDFNQHERMSPYNSAKKYGTPGNMPYFIYRYHNKEGVAYS